MSRPTCPTCGRVYLGRVSSKVTAAVELDVFQRLFSGQSQSAIGRDLGISTATVNALVHGKYSRNSGLRSVPTPTDLIAKAKALLAERSQTARAGHARSDKPANLSTIDRKTA